MAIQILENQDSAQVFRTKANSNFNEMETTKHQLIMHLQKIYMELLHLEIMVMLK